MKFRNTIALALIIFSTIPILLVTVMNLVTSTNSIKSTQAENFKALVSSNAASFSQLLRGLEREVTIMSTNSNIVGSLTDNNGTAKQMPNEQLIEYNVISRWISSVDEYEDAVITDKNGIIVCSYTDDMLGTDLSNNDYFIKTLSNSNAIIGNTKMSVDNSDTYMITVSKAIISSDEEYIGSLILYVSLDFFRSFINTIKLGEGGYAFITDSNGEVIYHPIPGMIGIAAETTATGDTINNAVYRYMRGEADLSGYYVSMFRDQKRILSYYILEDLSWILAVRQPYDYVMLPVSNMVSLTLIATAIFLVLAIIAGIAITKIFMRPVAKLNEAFSIAINEKKFSKCDINSKNEFGVLANNYNSMVEIANENLNALEKSYKENEFLAHYDTITGLANRTFLDKKLNSLIDSGIDFSVALMDMDDFKLINDIYGHSVGDSLIAQVGNRIKNMELGFEVISRIGGDEFVFVSSKPDYRDSMFKIVNVFDAPFSIEGTEIHLSGSLGVAFYPMNGADVSTLLENADAAMYEAKKMGKNSVFYFDEALKNRLSRHNKIKHMLLEEMGAQNIRMVYQPVYYSFTDKIISYESLLYIEDDSLGKINPLELISVAENSGLMVKLSYWTIESVCIFAKKLVDNQIPFEVVSVNVSNYQIMENAFVEKTILILKNIGLSPNHLELEIKESVFVHLSEANKRKIDALRSFGISIALDGFGATYSSLSGLAKLDVDVIKIDKSITRSILTDSVSRMILNSIMAISEKLGIKVVAEGVETFEQVEMLREFNCDKFQGYYYSHPLDEDEAMELVMKA